MEIVLEVEEQDRNTDDLLLWLRKEHIPDTSFTQKRGAQEADRMGADLIPVIVALLSAPAVIEVVRSIQAWITYRKPKGKVSIRLPDGASVDIAGENIDLEGLVRAVSKGITEK